jgi:CubicO group peptidase (beta-lactamase class C family)
MLSCFLNAAHSVAHHLLAAALSVAQAPTPAPARPAIGATHFPTLQQRISGLVAPLVDPNGAPGKAIGLVVGVSSPSQRLILGFGARTRFGTIAPGPDDIFEIGSLTKVLTGYLLAREMELGAAALTDPIDPHFPAGAPHFGATPITLLDLATHTSGLPHYPNNLHSQTPGNPAAGYTAQDLASFMSSYTLAVAPGTQFQYSNLGAGTLGHVLVQVSATANYEALLRQELADPLQMLDTRIHLSPAQQTRRVQGYQNGLPAPFNDIGEPLVGGGALRSTARDLLAFFEPATGLGPAAAIATWQIVLVPRRPSPLGVNADTGLLLNIEDHAGGRLYSKSGGTVGFTAQVAFMKQPRATVVVLTNCHDVQGLRSLANALVDLLREP